ncbi:MAG: hypothetical protein AB8G11_21590 [Saprospiraceae bacterium]
MKRVVVLLFIGISVISCNQNMDTDNASEQVDETVEIEDTLVIDKSVDYSEIGFQLMEEEVVNGLKLNMKVEEIEKITGKPHNITTFEYWGADGYEHQSRFYQDSTIDVNYIKLEDGSIVSDRIYIDNNPEYKTLQAIGLGSTKHEVLEAYDGQISSVSEENIIVGSIYGGLFFYLKDEKVTSLYLGAGAE